MKERRVTTVEEQQTWEDMEDEYEESKSALALNLKFQAMGSSNSSQDESLHSYNKSSSPCENIEVLDEKVSVISYDENVSDEDEEISQA